MHPVKQQVRIYIAIAFQKLTSSYRFFRFLLFQLSVPLRSITNDVSHATASGGQNKIVVHRLYNSTIGTFRVRSIDPVPE